MTPCIDFEPTPLSDHLVELRESFGLSQEEVATHTGVGYLPLVRLELGKEPTAEQLVALNAFYRASARLFGRDFDALPADPGFALAGAA
jgi:transcriptional regulator with XRE-family HTH domain